MDIGALGGLVFSFVILGWGILIAGPLSAFFDPPSIVLVVGGVFAAFFVSFPTKKALGIGVLFGKVFKTNPMNPQLMINKIVELALVARREGLLALESATGELKDDFLQKGVMLIVDGTDPELVKQILETDIETMASRHEGNRGMFDYLASGSPAFGMIGTLVGLVLMLKKLDDPSTIGPSMAVALITTFYGSCLANIVFTPFSTNLGNKSAEEVMVKQIMLEGLLSIQAGENPRIIEEKLKVFLPPKQRTSSQQAEGEN